MVMTTFCGRSCLVCDRNTARIVGFLNDAGIKIAGAYCGYGERLPRIVLADGCMVTIFQIGFRA